ncbi:MAG: DUF4159 domain-containing protein [Planctomycetota bacterium]
MKHPIRRQLQRLAFVLLAALVSSLVFTVPAWADVTGAQVKLAIRKGVPAVRSMQNADGTWPERHRPGGETCLATLALLHAGEAADSPAIAAALPYISSLSNEHVYVVALKIMVLAEIDAQVYAREIRAAAQWLISAQTSQGLWSYGLKAQRFDHSNSQFAMLGLHAAAQAGVKIPQTVWRKAYNAITRNQNDDGGWAYQATGSSYGSMTAAGVADLLILGARLGTGRGIQKGSDPSCGRVKSDQPLAAGMQWLGRHFRADTNPRRERSYVHYWLYAVERCGMMSGQRYFGKHDWYREGANYLVRTQSNNGLWNSQIVDTSFALLFLAKGHKSLLIQKLQWSDDDAWNPDPRGVAHLIAFIGDKLGQPVAWQAVRFDSPLEDWLAAPLLYIHGREFPTWNSNQRAKLREFVEQGGTLLFGACCGRREFSDGFQAFAVDTFPEVPLHELGAEHAVYHTIHDCPPSGLQGLDVGCRTSVLFLPKDISYLWQEGDVAGASKLALELGTNIAAYALGRRPLIDRLDVVILPEEREQDARPPARDALLFGQVVYDSDWRPFPRALVNLADFLQQEVNLDVVTSYRPLRLTDADLYTCPLLYMAGHYDFEFSAAERSALAEHLRRGGFLLVDNCCGPDPFDAAFRNMIRQTFPDSVLQPLSVDHPIFQGTPGFDVTTVTYGADVLRQKPNLTTPELWGLEIEGRLALIYSPYALGCGLDGQAFDGCWGLTSPDAQRLAANIVLYALTH